MFSLSPPFLYFTFDSDKPGGRWEETREEGYRPFMRKKNGVTTEDFMHVDHSGSSTGDFVS